MTTNSPPIPRSEQRESLWLVAALTVALLTARLLAAGYTSFFENDSISLATGAANILRDSGGGIYRYGPQVGYYQLLVGLTRLFGGDVLTIPLIQVTLSVIAGTLIPLMGLMAFRGDLSRLERWLLAATLAANPILWMASRYGSSAMVSVPLALGGLVLLSNRPARSGELAALALLAAAIFVRADAVLITPGVALLLWRNHGGLRPALLRIVGLGIFVAAVFGLLFATDPRMRTLAMDVAEHLGSPFETMFWEYLLWSVSPFPLIFAGLGLRAMFPGRRWLLAVLAAWSLPVLVFYFPATTQPRYFLLTTFPAAIATAVGMASVVDLAGKRRRLALAAAVALGSVHLLVGLGRFGNGPGHERGYLREATVNTHTGPLWTGAFLWKSYRDPGLSNATVLHPRFGQFGFERSLTMIFAHLASETYRGRHVLLLFRPGFGNTLHFYGQAAGVRIVANHGGTLWDNQFEMAIGGARLTTIGLRQVAADSTWQLPVAGGDEVWFLEGRRPPTVSSIDGRLPAGLVLVADSQLTDVPDVSRFRVVRAQ